MHDVGVEVKLSAQLHVQSLEFSSPAVVRSGKDALEAHSVLGNGGSNVLQGSAHQLVHFAEEKLLKINGNSGSL